MTEELVAMRQTETVEDKFFGNKKGKAFKSQLADRKEMIQEKFDCESAQYAKKVQAVADKLIAKKEEEERNAQEELEKKLKERSEFSNRRLR